MHGVEISDPYRWLEDQQSPETRAWITEQNAYTRAILDAVPGRERLRAQLEKLTRVDYQSAPTVRNGRYFFMRRGAEQDQFAIIVREGIAGDDRVLVDPATLSSDGSVSVEMMSVTPDGGILVISKRTGGEDEVEVLFLDVETGELLADRLPHGLYYEVFVLPDKSGFLYSRRRAEGTRILEHRFGTPVSEDQVLFGDGIPDDKLIGLRFSDDGRFAAAFVRGGGGGNLQSQVFVMDHLAGKEFKPLITDIAASFWGAFGGKTLFLETRWNAPNGRVLAVDLENPAREHWREVIPHSEDSVIRGARAVGGKLLIRFLHNVRTRLAVFEPDGTLLRDISLPTLGSASFFTRKLGFQRNFLRLPVVRPTTDDLSVRPGYREAVGLARAERAGGLRCDCHASSLVRVEGRHPRPDVRCRKEGSQDRRETANDAMVQSERRSLVQGPQCGWTKAAFSRCLTFGVEESSAKNGIVPESWRTSRTVLMTSSRPPNG